MLLELRNVVKKQGAVIVNGLDAAFSDNKIYGVITSSPEEKNAVIGLMTGCEEISAGQILVNSVNFAADPIHAKRRIGYLPYDAPLYDEMTVSGFLKFICEVKGVSGRDISSAVEATINNFDLSFYGNVVIKNLLPEYRQLVGLAQAFIGSPRYVILDEPFRNLSPLKTILLRLFIEQVKEDVTVIIFSDRVNDIARLCDEVLVIYNGKKAIMGGKAELAEYLSCESTDGETVRISREKLVAVLKTPSKTQDDFEETEEEQVGAGIAADDEQTASENIDEEKEKNDNDGSAVVSDDEHSDSSVNDEEYIEMSFEDLIEAVLIKINTEYIGTEPEEVEINFEETETEDTNSDTSEKMSDETLSVENTEEADKENETVESSVSDREDTENGSTDGEEEK